MNPTRVFEVYLTCNIGGSNKFYRITVQRREDGVVALASYGPIGRTLSTAPPAVLGCPDNSPDRNHCSTPMGFLRKVNAQIASKLKKGYVVNSTYSADAGAPIGHAQLTYPCLGLPIEAAPRPTKTTAKRAKSVDAWLSSQRSAVRGAVMV